MCLCGVGPGELAVSCRSGGHRADRQDESDDERTEALIQLLPRLIAKTQTDPSRLSAVLELVKKLKIEVYLDLRKTTVSICTHHC